MRTQDNPFQHPQTEETPLADWERELLGDPPAPVQEVWSTRTGGQQTRMTGRASAVVALDAETETAPVRRDGHIPFVTSGKHRIAKRPFSRLTAPAFDPALATNNPA